MILGTFKVKADELTRALGRAAEWAANKTTTVALWPVPYYSRWGMYTQALFVVVTLVWFEYRPDWAVQGPGVAMAFLAVAAILMAVRGPDATRVEGGVWIAVSCLLFVGEMHFIALDRKSHDTDKAELRKREEATRQEQIQSFAGLKTALSRAA